MLNLTMSPKGFRSSAPLPPAPTPPARPLPRRPTPDGPQASRPGYMQPSVHDPYHTSSPISPLSLGDSGDQRILYRNPFDRHAEVVVWPTSPSILSNEDDADGAQPNEVRCASQPRQDSTTLPPLDVHINDSVSPSTPPAHSSRGDDDTRGEDNFESDPRHSALLFTLESRSVNANHDLQAIIRPSLSQESPCKEKARNSRDECESSSCMSTATSRSRRKDRSLFLALEAIIQADIAVKGARRALEDALSATSEVIRHDEVPKSSDEDRQELKPPDKDLGDSSEICLSEEVQTVKIEGVQTDRLRHTGDVQASIEQSSPVQGNKKPKEVRRSTEKPGRQPEPVSGGKVFSFMEFASSCSSISSAPSLTDRSEAGDRDAEGVARSSTRRADDQSMPCLEIQGPQDKSSMESSEDDHRRHSSRRENSPADEPCESSADMAPSSIRASLSLGQLSSDDLGTHPSLSLDLVHQFNKAGWTQAPSTSELWNAMASDWLEHEHGSGVSTPDSSPRPLDMLGPHGDVIPQHMLDSSGEFVVCRPNEKVRLVHLDADGDDQNQSLEEEEEEEGLEVYSEENQGDDLSVSKTRSSLRRISEEAERSCEGEAECTQSSTPSDVEALIEGNQKSEGPPTSHEDTDSSEGHEVAVGTNDEGGQMEHSRRSSGEACLDIPRTPLRSTSLSSHHPQHAKRPSSVPLTSPPKVLIHPTPVSTTVLLSLIKNAVSSTTPGTLSGAIRSPTPQSRQHPKSPSLLSPPATSSLAMRARSHSSGDIVKPLNAVLDVDRSAHHRWSSSTSKWDIRKEKEGSSSRIETQKEVTLRSDMEDAEELLLDIPIDQDDSQSQIRSEERKAKGGPETPLEEKMTLMAHSTSGQFTPPHAARLQLNSITASDRSSLPSSDLSSNSLPSSLIHRSSSGDTRPSSILIPYSTSSERGVPASGCSQPHNLAHSHHDIDFDPICTPKDSPQPVSAGGLLGLSDLPSEKDYDKMLLTPPGSLARSSSPSHSATEENVELLQRFPSVPINGAYSSKDTTNLTRVPTTPTAAVTDSTKLAKTWLGRKMTVAAQVVSGRQGQDPKESKEIVTSPGLAAAMQFGNDDRPIETAESMSVASDRDSLTGLTLKSVTLKGSRLFDKVRKDGTKWKRLRGSPTGTKFNARSLRERDNGLEVESENGDYDFKCVEPNLGRKSYQQKSIENPEIFSPAHRRVLEARAAGETGRESCSALEPSSPLQEAMNFSTPQGTNSSHPVHRQVGSLATTATTTALIASYDSQLYEPKGRKSSTSQASCSNTDLNDDFASAKNSFHVDEAHRELSAGKHMEVHHRHLASQEFNGYWRRSAENDPHQGSNSHTDAAHDRIVEASPSSPPAGPSAKGLLKSKSKGSITGSARPGCDRGSFEDRSLLARPSFDKISQFRKSLEGYGKVSTPSHLVLNERRSEQTIPATDSPSPSQSTFAKVIPLRGLRDRFTGASKSSSPGQNCPATTLEGHIAESPDGSSSEMVQRLSDAEEGAIVTPLTLRLQDLGRGLGLDSSSLSHDIIEASRSPLLKTSTGASMEVYGVAVGLPEEQRDSKVFPSDQLQLETMASPSTISQDVHEWTSDKREAFRKWLETEAKGRGYHPPNGESEGSGR